MFSNYLIYVIALIVICSKVSSNTCDSTNGKLEIREGILGEVPSFPWLGVLRIPVLRENREESKIAATGVVLVTIKFVLINADDVSKIPIVKLRRDARVYLISEHKTPTTYKVKDITLHPEYEYATYNTLALLEINLDLEEDSQEHRGALNPICWPGKSFNTSNELYIVGYTDERLRLEKVLYKGQYVPKEICDEYYKRLSFVSDKMQEPKQYVCSFAMNHQHHCLWDNGMLLISNATGIWTLVGFGTAGPGCSAPARFVDISHYIDWVQSATTDPALYDYYGEKRDDSYT